MLSVEGAQPIRQYEPPISIVVWTRGDPCSDADCVLRTAALASGPAHSIEYGRWGIYNLILRFRDDAGKARYFLADGRYSEPTDAARRSARHDGHPPRVDRERGLSWRVVFARIIECRCRS